MKASEYLQHRHDELAYGSLHWVQHAPKEGTTEACLMKGGPWSISELHAANSTLFHRLVDYLRGVIGHTMVGSWNDNYARNLDEVLDVILRAKKLAEADDD